MEKEFITYKQALALKELGFDERCFSRYYESGKLADSLSYLHHNYFGQVNAPLYQQAFRWFREKHNLQAEILWRGDMECFCYKTGKFKRGSHNFSKDDYKTYEEAESACLDKLIEITRLTKS